MEQMKWLIAINPRQNKEQTRGCVLIGTSSFPLLLIKAKSLQVIQDCYLPFSTFATVR